MDSRYSATRDELYNLQMEVKQVQYTQSNHAERLMRLEKRQADDAALKSVWNSPFPGVLSGTPQQDPVSAPHNDMFDDLDEQGEQLLGSLQLGPAEEEPIRRGAASRANSVRFDESALHGSSWGGQNNRHSGDFGPARPSSGLLMERSLSHKSDGRHSSAGHSVHSHHSVASGRASSLGLDTNFAIGDDDESPFEVPGLPASFYVLGTVPSIIRCWLTPNYAHKTLLYADVCTGSQRSTVEYSLLRDLGLDEDIQRDVDGAHWARLTIYFAEAVITQGAHRSTSPERAVPHIAVLFEVIGLEQPSATQAPPAIRIYIGSDALRAHSADILFSRNTMMLYSDDNDRLRVPFVRPEDDATFRHIYTTSIVPEKPKLNANAAPFVFGEEADDPQVEQRSASPHVHYADSESQQEPSPAVAQARLTRRSDASETDSDKASAGAGERDQGTKQDSESSGSRAREPSTGIWSSWRHGSGSGQDGASKENGLLSGYQPPSRGGGRNMKVLKPQKASSSATKASAAYEPPLAPRTSSEGRRKSLASSAGDSAATPASRWDAKRTVSQGGFDGKTSSSGKENRNGPALTRSVNPVGVASAFSWMTPPSGKS
ncbi:ubiquitin carboxyl-terminal hydrolase 19 [Sarocladium implicatum]|nr:ubiquitin carboxyl-terminal hydrolase 19 [Sarocladium implicatum]